MKQVTDDKIDLNVLRQYSKLMLFNHKIIKAMNYLQSLDLEVRNLLGSGSFAQVYECFDLKENKTFAVKMIKKQAVYNSKKRLFAKEAEILAAIDHKNIVKFYSFVETDQCLIIKMEHIKGGTLKNLIQQRKRLREPFADHQIALFFRHLLQGIKYLHSLNIIHRDLKTENILFENSQDLSTVKIVDFGLSAKLEIHNPANIKAQCGTLLYMAPQIFNKPSYTKSVDLWSCAVIMFMMYNEGRHPFYYSGMKTDEFKLKLKNESFPILPDALAQNFMEKISKKQYEQRYNVNDALRHPWITRNNDDQIPLSIHESYKGFGSTNQINTLLRLFLTIGKVVPHRQCEIQQSYRFKINDFINSNEAVRVYSPSRRKMKDKNNELFNKMKQIFHTSQQVKVISDTMSLSQNFSQEASPTLKKHQSFFQSLFQKEKSFEISKAQDKFQLRKIELKNLQTNFDLIDKEQIIFNLKTRRKKTTQDQQEEEEVIATIDKQIQLKIESQIEECVNQTIKSSQRASQHSKKRIFQKKISMEDRYSKQKGQLKMTKNFSLGIQSQKIEVPPKKQQNFLVSTKQIYTRRTMSPIKNSFSRHMVFNLAGKNLSYTARK